MRKPNFLVTGVPGVGKSTVAAKVAELTGMRILNLNEIAIRENFLLEYDEILECHVLDEDSIINYISEDVMAGNNILEYHSCDMFTPKGVDYVFILRCKTDVLYDRLTQRGYSKIKIENNIQAEIFGEILTEARGAFPEDCIFTFDNNELSQVETIANEMHAIYTGLIN